MFYTESPVPSLSNIEERLARPEVAAFPVLRLAVLRNVMMEFIEPYLKYLACEMGFRSEVMFGGLDNFVQEALGGAPALFQDKIDAVLIFTPLPALSPLLDTGFSGLSQGQIEEELGRIIQLFSTVVGGVRAQTDAMILWHGMEAPIYPALGIQDAQQHSGQVSIVKSLNEGLRKVLSATGNAYLVNMEACLARLGAQQFYDTRYWYLARLPYSRKGLAEIACEDFKFLRSLKGRTRKCLVVDCDNTLWGGIVGEDGIEGIKLGHTHPGSSFVEFQLEILSHYHRGVIVAICSKNNPDDVWEVFDKHPDMVLKREHIAAWQINWQDKVTNLRALASELNIGTDSMVFVDDSDFEANLVREQMPEVQVLQLPKERPGEYRWVLAASGAFDLPRLTDEDRKRGELYQAENLRRQERVGSADLEKYCRSLSIKLEIGLVDALTIPRVAQQTQKTNQFNLTTRRYTDAEISRFGSSPDHDILWLRVSDKFGDLGIVGSCILTYRGEDAVIDTLLISCRVLGRGIEGRFLAEVMWFARRRGAKRMLGQYIPTNKNQQVAGFFLSQGFSAASPQSEEGSWFVSSLDNLPVLDLGVFAFVSVPRDDL